MPSGIKVARRIMFNEIMLVKNIFWNFGLLSGTKNAARKKGM